MDQSLKKIGKQYAPTQNDLSRHIGRLMNIISIGLNSSGSSELLICVKLILLFMLLYSGTVSLSLRTSFNIVLCSPSSNHPISSWLAPEREKCGLWEAH